MRAWSQRSKGWAVGGLRAGRYWGTLGCPSECESGGMDCGTHGQGMEAHPLRSRPAWLGSALLLSGCREALACPGQARC